MFIIINQSTTILQINNVQKRQLQTIKCGTKYLKETIGISITNKHLYQFLFKNNTIQIIRYDYQKSTKDNEINGYKLDLIDGQMLANGLEDLEIPKYIVEQLMTVIQWTGDDENQHSANNNNEPSTIISITMSINKNGRICIYCLKSFDQIKYHFGYYNQEIDSDKVITFIDINDQEQIRGIISYENKGILSSVYYKLSYCLNVFKLNENYQSNIDIEWTKILVIDTDPNFLYEINEYPDEQEQKILTKLFGEIFGQHEFTYGFVDDNQIFLFSNQNEKIISFSMYIFTLNNDDLKFSFNIQSYRDFFHCNNTFYPNNIDDNKHNDSIINGTTISTVIHPLSTTNDSKTTTTEPSLDEQYPSFLDLIPSDIAKEFIKEIPLNKTEKSVSDSNELRSFAMSINKQNKIRIVFIKPFNNQEYDILDYNEQKNMNRIDSFTRISKEENNIIMGIISNKNSGIILLFYNKLSYRLNIIFKANKRFDNIDFELAKSLVVDSGLKFLYQLDEEPNEQQEQQELTKSFAQIFGPHTFTYGFVDNNDQIYLFSKQNEKLMKFSMDIFFKNNITQKKYPFKLQSFNDFFHCNRPLVPVKIDDNKQTTISTTLTTTVKPPRTKHDSTTTGKQHPSTTTTTTTISTMKTARISIKKKPSRIIESLRLSDGPKQTCFCLRCLTMYNNKIVIIKWMMFIIIYQFTTALQLQTTIPCGSKYLKETIGLSITNNNLYQFLFIDNTIKIIRYDYRKLSENIDKNDYKLNLIDGQMMANGLHDLIPSKVVKELMKIIRWNGNVNNTDNSNDEQPIISMAMSINEYGIIRIYCLKTLNQTKYYIGDYNQEIDFVKIKPFMGVNGKKHIICTISDQNTGIISSVYIKSSSSYQIKMIKLKEKHYGIKNYEWKKSLVVDSSLQFIYVINGRPTEPEKQILTKSFAQIFGPHTFTYGFVADNQMFLFSNQGKKLITFSTNFTRNNNSDSEQKYPFKLQSYRDFFHCNKPLVPVKPDDDFTMKTKSTNSIDDKSSTTTTEPLPSITDEPDSLFTKIIIISIPILILLLILLTGLIALQESVTKPIPCGAEEYSEQSIGLSIIDDKIYQFILVK
ncbi:hypothetical protein DERP_004274 [Dermatophagoides pteronyssinus]|uniref:Uncharacterized protein n=1 Tax=Dermatophagoides pteronyssinus TaxID=6956 RepID=A0ABQ8J977_DERPT|nr:hypothetical protein DERP_004274 [Dermatophagoides pteronyssinus]